MDKQEDRPSAGRAGVQGALVWSGTFRTPSELKSSRRTILRLKLASGLRWVQLAGLHKLRINATELHSPALAAALGKKAEAGEPLNFSLEEWHAFSVPSLRTRHYITSGERVFRPGTIKRATGARVLDEAGGKAITKLAVRAGPEVTSKQLKAISPADEDLVVLTEREVDGKLRAHVYQDATPRGIAVTPLGWVTAKKEGARLIERTPLVKTAALRGGLEGEPASNASSPRSPGRSPYSTPASSYRFSPGGVPPTPGSVASTIAHGRLSRLEKFLQGQKDKGALDLNPMTLTTLQSDADGVTVTEEVSHAQ